MRCLTTLIIIRTVSSLFLLLAAGTVSAFFTSLRPNASSTNTRRLLQAENNELHLLTFDLDDTIFPITPVIRDANSIMIRTLQEFGYHDADNDEIIAASKRIRRELKDRGEDITYTELRKRSIRCEMERLRSNNIENRHSDGAVDESTIDTVFDSWLSERHASANRNLFPFTSNSLQYIRKQYPSVVIGAITNGRGNPLEMPLIAQYFDFCVSGEDVGVFPLRKPDRGIYEAALKQFAELKGWNENEVGWNWIHVGDDLANDIGASAACGAKTVWLTKQNESIGEKGVGFWSTATPEEMQKRRNMDEVAKLFVDAEIFALDGLADAIGNIMDNR